MKGKTVYSTRGGDQRKEPDGPSRPVQSLPPSQQTIKIRRDKKGRRGKMVTVASGFTLAEADLEELARLLKTACGAGGTTKSEAEGQVIEVQGDQRDKLAEKLKSLGYKVKFAGG